VADTPKVRALDPALLDSLSGLSLVARTVVEGYMAGQHRSPHRGSSVEFAQHREYVHGDEMRHIDWKIFAKSDRLVVKEFVEETNFDCHFLVDASESMAFQSGKRSKFDYARWCAASLAHLVLSQRDASGLVVFDEEVRAKVPPGNGPAQRADMIRVLEEAQPSGQTGMGEVLKWMATRIPRKSIVVVLSDFFDEPEKIVEGLRRLSFAGHEPILMQILDPQEVNFDFSGLHRLDGLEGGGKLKIDARAIREAYLDELKAHHAVLDRHTRALSIDFVQMTTDTGLDVALSTYLAHRSSRARGGARS
jgi:uncharacterized protein (DUF58 family)